jgi:outer membrane protein OmpA-like peptidoglycan-associated protein
MDTDGKGKSQPVDTNNTPIGKANNRRVEFIKK